MVVVGLTGGIGSGKSVIAKIFEVIGIPVYSSDEAAKILMQSSKKIADNLKLAFGDQVFGINGALNKQYLANAVFSNTEKLKKLNAIVHPEVKKDFISWKSKHENVPYVIKEAAIMIESNSYKDLDYLILVKASKKTRIKRVMQRDNVLEMDVLKRMNNQLPDSEKEKLANFIINNNDDDMVIEQVLEIHKKLIIVKIR